MMEHHLHMQIVLPLETRLLASAKFDGTSEEDGQLWWHSFMLYNAFRELTNSKVLQVLPLLLREGAITWFIGQDNATKGDWTVMETAFTARYFRQAINRWKHTGLNRHRLIVLIIG